MWNKDCLRESRRANMTSVAIIDLMSVEAGYAVYVCQCQIAAGNGPTHSVRAVVDDGQYAPTSYSAVSSPSCHQQVPFPRGAARITRSIRQRGFQTTIYSPGSNDDVSVDSKPTSRNLSLRNRIKSPQLLLTSSSAAITADDVVHRTHCSQRTQPADKVLAVRGLYTNYARRGSRGCAQKNG